MSLVELDLRGLGPGQAPAREAVAPAVDAEALLVRGPVPALAAVLAALHRAGRTAVAPVSWEPADDDASVGLARALGVGSGGEERELSLVRDDHGGVLLHHGRVEAAGDDQRRPLARRLGAQAYNDAVQIADGLITRIDVRPDWQAVDTLGVAVMTLPLRPARRSRGRAVQIACDPARVLRDGVPYPRLVSRWTWYADDRVRWRLRP
ncbi:hypothetical protein DQ238_06835 [Geodermatophilus sp. TF02-6]|uniref:hypothetical protein n=1 Tax=Geodermatophilus sp. TF02-6 TaxID=2250575 RepID=UPI000DE909D4|nr:hypothetical protein [Geodermatophilus sp. TF02-6]RBY81726.1 hypothetical protein DQ238_06835 [Geodermatophilus sp. TF02-6]